MKIGATDQEVQKAKEQELPSYSAANNRKTVVQLDNPVYYYQSDETRVDPHYYPEMYVPIENYADELIFQLHRYLGQINRSYDVDKLETISTLRRTLFKNDKSIKLLPTSESPVVWQAVQDYTKCIMQIVGDLAECVIVDSCVNDLDINIICINVALFKKDVAVTYDIPYDEYVAYSTSFKHMVYLDSTGKLELVTDNVHYNPHHTSQDIGWCKRDNVWDQLKSKIEALPYEDNAKIQVKATLDCRNLDLANYVLTPVIVFDLDHGYNNLIERYPHHRILSAYDLFPSLAIQIEEYFKIIAAYVCGLTNKLNISEMDLKNDQRLKAFFRASPTELARKKKEWDMSGLVKMAQDAGKPIILAV